MNLGHVLSVLADVMFVLNQFVLQHLFHVGAFGVQLHQFRLRRALDGNRGLALTAQKLRIFLPYMASAKLLPISRR